VSTYSLVYTTSTGAYSGGVLAPSGDIHFINYSGTIGQKVSTTGVVSTYALLSTAGTQRFIGGIVSPTGEIYFIPSNSPVGQKISTNAATPFGLDSCLSSYLNKF
jgi:hypothetical protein